MDGSNTSQLTLETLSLDCKETVVILFAGLRELALEIKRVTGLLNILPLYLFKRNRAAVELVVLRQPIAVSFDQIINEMPDLVEVKFG